MLYTLVNQTKRTLVMVDSELTSGKWFMEQHPPSYILPYSKGVIVTASKGPFSGTEGFCHYRVEPATTPTVTTNNNNTTTPHFVKLLWINPKVFSKQPPILFLRPSPIDGIFFPFTIVYICVSIYLSINRWVVR